MKDIFYKCRYLLVLMILTASGILTFATRGWFTLMVTMMWIQGTYLDLSVTGSLLYVIRKVIWIL
ncbi:hypothetical protein DDJ69_32295 [Klebsiella oxytoca]|nr:hypothetical protein DDJ69_32295 [Klebsiella oxytoca]